MRGLTILLCSLLFTVVAAQNSTSSGFSPEQDDSVASNSSSTSPEQPQCQICADGGNCSKAYKGGRGQYCYDWVDNLGTSRPCCCPTDAVCKPSTDECLCSYNGVQLTNFDDNDYLKLDDHGNFLDDPEKMYHTISTVAIILIIVGVIFSIASCIGGCMIVRRLQKRRREQNTEQDAPYMAQPVDQSGTPIAGAYCQPDYYPPQGAYNQPGDYPHYPPQGAYNQPGDYPQQFVSRQPGYVHTV